MNESSIRKSTRLFIDTNGWLDSPENISLRNESEITRSNIHERYDGIQGRLNKLTSEFGDLQDLANELSKNYQVRSEKLSKLIDRKEILQEILDHRLQSSDVEIFCNYIKILFEYIIESTNLYLSDTNYVSSIVAIHKKRISNRDVDVAYNKVCKLLSIDNSGKIGSHMYQLYTFLRDFHDGGNKGYNCCTNSSNESMSSNSTESEFSGPVTPELGMPSTVEYAIHRINTKVQSKVLARALIACVSAVDSIASTKKNHNV